MRSWFNLNRETSFVVKARVIVATATAVVVAIVLSAACGSTERATLVFAAASLVDVLEEVRIAYEQDTGESVQFNFAGSNLIANQIITGAPADGVVVAGWTAVDKLVKSKKASEVDAIQVLSNRLVAVHPAGSAISHRSVQELVGAGRIAMPDPETAPAGEYFEAALKEQSVWTEVQPQIIPALDARAALTAAATGNVAYALVYETDALSNDDVEIAFAIEGKGMETMPRYYAAPLLGNDDAVPFIEYLATPRAIAIFERHGFRR